MVIYLNTNCCGGKSLERWNRVKDYFLNSDVVIIQTTDNNYLSELKKHIEKGETQFLAAGGDGTVNYLLNFIIKNTAPDRLPQINLGAIGIGSSNDFHKPSSVMIEDISVCHNFINAYLRDIGVIKYESINGKIEKYFFINASIGITAQANKIFNSSFWLLRTMKRTNTKLAILFSAIKTILFYKNLNAEICINNNKLRTQITNLGITKNPHFSGDFCYDCKADYTNGKFDVHLAQYMNKYEIFKLMSSLTRNNFSKLKKVKSWQSDTITITSPKDFEVEYDGEVILTNNVEFTILKQAIKVCK